MIFAHWYQSKYMYSIKYQISKKLLKNYLLSDYEFHIQNNSAFFIRNISAETSTIINSVLSPLIIIFTESIMIIFITHFVA